MTFYTFQSMPSSCKHRILEHRIHKVHFQAPSRGARTRSPSLACDVKFMILPSPAPHLYWPSLQATSFGISIFGDLGQFQQGTSCKTMHVHDMRMHQRMAFLVLFQHPTCFRFFENFGLAIELIALVRHDKKNAAWL